MTAKKNDTEREEIIEANKELFAANEKLNAELAEEREAHERQMAEMRAEIDALIAKSVPASTPERHDAMEVDQVDKGSADFDDDGNLIKPILGEVNDPIIQEKIAMEKFMTDELVVNIQGSPDIRHSKTFSIAVNGDVEVFTTGETKTVKRKFVEGLCRAKNVAYTNREVVDENGVKKFVYDPRSGLRFGFSVMSDPHPRGRDWLEHTLRQQ